MSLLRLNSVTKTDWRANYPRLFCVVTCWLRKRVYSLTWPASMHIYGNKRDGCVWRHYRTFKTNYSWCTKNVKRSVDENQYKKIEHLYKKSKSQNQWCKKKKKKKSSGVEELAFFHELLETPTHKKDGILTWIKDFHEKN